MSIGTSAARRGALTIGLGICLLSSAASLADAQSPSPEPPLASPSPEPTPAPTPCLFVATPPPDGTTLDDPSTCLSSASGFAWQQATLPGPEGGVWPIHGLAANGGGDVVLLGQTAATNGKPLAWHSVDGLTWDPVKLSWPKGMAPIAVATVGNDFLAIGGGKTGTATASSGGGDRWVVRKSAVPGATKLYASPRPTTAPTVLGASGKSTPPTVWRTPDGVKWSKALPLPATTTAGSVSPPTLIAASPTGAIGAASTDGGLWAAPDGANWQAATLPVTGEGLTVTALTATPTGLLLVLNQAAAGGTVTSSIWASSDGLAWLMVHSIDGTALLHASSGPAGSVVQAEHLLLTSADGVTWTEHPLTEFDSSVSDVVETPAGRVLVSGTTPDLASGTLWMGTLPTP